MRASIFVFYIAVLATSAAVVAQSDPDTLYRERTEVAKAREAVAIWSERLTKNPRDFESAWKLARAAYWLGGHDEPRRAAPTRARRRGGRQATQLEPARPEGYFWMAASMGPLAESFGMRQGLRYRSPIKDALEKVLQSTPPTRTARRTARWAAGTTRCRGSSAAARRSRRSTCAVADLRYREHGLALLPGRDPVRARSRRRRDRRAAARDRRAGQSRVGARGPRVQAAGRGSAQEREK